MHMEIRKPCEGCGRTLPWRRDAWEAGDRTCARCIEDRRRAHLSRIVEPLVLAGGVVLLAALFALVHWIAEREADNCRARGGRMATGMSLRGDVVLVCVMPEGR